MIARRLSFEEFVSAGEVQASARARPTTPQQGVPGAQVRTAFSPRSSVCTKEGREGSSPDQSAAAGRTGAIVPRRLRAVLSTEEREAQEIERRRQEVALMMAKNARRMAAAGVKDPASTLIDRSASTGKLRPASTGQLRPASTGQQRCSRAVPSTEEREAQEILRVSSEVAMVKTKSVRKLGHTLPKSARLSTCSPNSPRNVSPRGSQPSHHLAGEKPRTVSAPRMSRTMSMGTLPARSVTPDGSQTERSARVTSSNSTGNQQLGVAALQEGHGSGSFPELGQTRLTSPREYHQEDHDCDSTCPDTALQTASAADGSADLQQRLMLAELRVNALEKENAELRKIAQKKADSHDKVKDKYPSKPGRSLQKQSITSHKENDDKENDNGVGEVEKQPRPQLYNKAHSHTSVATGPGASRKGVR